MLEAAADATGILQASNSIALESLLALLKVCFHYERLLICNLKLNLTTLCSKDQEWWDRDPICCSQYELLFKFLVFLLYGIVGFAMSVTSGRGLTLLHFAPVYCCLAYMSCNVS